MKHVNPTQDATPYPKNALNGAIATPPVAIEQMDRLRGFLERLHYDAQPLFHSLFELGDPAPAAELGDDLKLLLDSGICVENTGLVQSKFMIKKVYDAFILTDFPHYRGEDRVLYLAEDESVYVAHAMPDCTGRTVLDIGTGSGVIAITACQHGATHVTALDINERAFKFARFNARLNGCSDRIDFVASPIKDFPAATKYDLVVSNPPFIAMPPDGTYRKSGAAGFDGLGVINDIIDRLDELMHEHSMFLMLVLSPGGKHFSKVEEDLLDRFSYRRRRIVSTELYGGPHDIDIIFMPFADEPRLEEWRAEIGRNNYTHIHCFLLEMMPDISHSFLRKVQHPFLQKTQECGTWWAKYVDIKKSKELT